MKKQCTLALLAVYLILNTAGAQDITLLGGAGTSTDLSKRAYDQSIPHITDSNQLLLQDLGNTGFLRDFGRVKINGMIRLGPQFNARSCAQCHVGNGRGAGQLSHRQRFSDTVVKVSIESGSRQSPVGPIPVPRIGVQIRDHASKPKVPAGYAALRWNTVQGRYPDGTPYSLRAPVLTVRLRSTPLSSDIRVSVRRAPPIFGAGLLEAIPDGEILSRADPYDANRDGISGRPNFVWDVREHKQRLGRFGFKAGNPTLLQQVAAAYAVDMGVTNSLFRSGRGKPEIAVRILEATTFYTATRAVPAARMQIDPEVMAGKHNFQNMGCAACHAVGLHTASGVSTALSNQTIHPFTDLLLHDMGPGLADNRSEYVASGSEWRTTPLWGIGLTGVVLNGQGEGYLHDGRARTLEEAILWHGGEAAASRERFMSAPAQERQELIIFLRSL